MLKRLVLLFAVLALVAAACGGDSGDDGTTTTAAPSDGDVGQETPSGGTLETVINRGELICGVSTTAVGFAEFDAEGRATGFDADYCRAVAAAVLGDSEAVQFRGLTAAERFEALKNGEIDVLIRNTTWTQSRDVDIGVQFAATTYYDGQQMMADPARVPGVTPESSFEAIDGAIVCTNAGTTTEKNITEGAQVAGVEITLDTGENFTEAMEKFRSGTCDVVTTDGSGLYGNRAADVINGTPGADTWVIFPTGPISKEPLGPVTRQGDDNWFDIVQWTVFATFIADENGVTSGNIDSTRSDTPELERLFGTHEGELQSSMGLDPEAYYNVIKQVGNYSEIFAKNLTVPLGLVPEPFNVQWFEGGQIYSPPAR